MTWHLNLPYPKPPLSLNDRFDRRKEARLIADMRRDGARLLLAAATPAERAAWPLDHVDVALVWRVGTKTRRDAENPVPTLKALCDGLTDAGLVLDDVPAYMTKHMPSIVYTRDAAALKTPLVLIVSEPT